MWFICSHSTANPLPETVRSRQPCCSLSTQSRKPNPLEHCCGDSTGSPRAKPTSPFSSCAVKGSSPSPRHFRYLSTQFDSNYNEASTRQTPTDKLNWSDSYSHSVSRGEGV